MTVNFIHPLVFTFSVNNRADFQKLFFRILLYNHKLCQSKQLFLKAKIDHATRKVPQGPISYLYNFETYVTLYSVQVWVSNTRPAWLYYEASGHNYKLCIYYKNYKIIQALGCNTYCYFSRFSPVTNSQLRVWPCVIKKPDIYALQNCLHVFPNTLYDLIFMFPCIMI